MSDDIDQILLSGARNGSIEVVTSALKKGADIHAKNPDNRTSIIWAAMNGYTPIVIKLLENGADLNDEDRYKTTALNWAAKNNNINVLHVVLEKIKDSNLQDETGKTPLNTQDKTGKTPLHWAAIHGNVEAVNSLLENGADANIQDETGKAPLHWAAKNNKIDSLTILLKKGADPKIQDKTGKTPLHWAAMQGNIEAVECLLENSIDPNIQDKNGKTPLHWSAKNNKIDSLTILLKKGAEPGIQDKNGRTPLEWAALKKHKAIMDILRKQDSDGRTPILSAAQGNYWETVVTLLDQGAEIKYLSGNQPELLKQHVESSSYDNKLQLLQLIENRLLELSIEHWGEFREQSEQLGLEKVEESGSSCPPRRRRRRDLAPCAKKDKREHPLFPYEPLQEYVSLNQRQAAKLYSQLILLIAWEQGKPLNNLLRYQRYLGDILEEGVINQSPREQQRLRDHYQQAQNFFQNNPKTNLLKAMADDFKPLTGHSVLLENGEHWLLIFNEAGLRYQLYSPEFNYRHFFHTRTGISWAKMSAFVNAFFQWKTGRRDWHPLVLQQPLPDKTLVELQAASFWQPDTLAPDSVLLAREQTQLIEGIPAQIVRELVRINGQVVDFATLQADFFQQTTGIQLRVENIHSVFTELTATQQHALVQAVNKYHWSADNTLLELLTTDDRSLWADYQERVMNALKAAGTLTLEHLSDFSWQSLKQAFDHYHDISPELTQQVLANLKELHATAAKRAWAKGVVTQALFFLPNMILAGNTGQVGGIAARAGLLVTDGIPNDSYSRLLESLKPVFSEVHISLLRKLPVTSPVFKALTLHLIVNSIQQLQSLPPDSEQQQPIKRCLGEQYFTLGLMTTELFGFELEPRRIGLIAEKLISEAITFRKENLLDIPFWEAFMMILGFEQDKLQFILKERHLVELNLATANNLNTRNQTPYGWLLIKVPLLDKLEWQDIDEQQIPPESRQHIVNQPEPLSWIGSAIIRESGGFRQILRHNPTAVGYQEKGHTLDSDPIKSTWQRGSYAAQAVATHVDWTTSSLGCQEDNIFLANPKEALTNYQRIASVTAEDYAFCLQKTPVKISGPGLAALYRSNRTFPNSDSQRNIYLGFDPREGDITLLIHPSGLQEIDKIYQNHNPDHSLSNASYSLTVQIGSKEYPPSIIFQPQLGLLMVKESSQRLHCKYFINSDSTPFYLYDDALTTRITISPPRDRQIGFIVRSYDLTIFQLQTWSPNISQPLPTIYPFLYTDSNPVNLKKNLQSLLPHQISTLHLPNNKKYLQLTWMQQQIAGMLTLSAEQVQVLFAKGQDAYQSGIDMSATVASFVVTVMGHLQIKQGNTQLFFIGEKPGNTPIIRYSKPLTTPCLPLYQLELEALQPVLDSLSKPNPRELHFSTPGLHYKWITGVEQRQPSELKIVGTIKDQRSQLLLEKNKSTLSQLLDDQPPRILAVDHYTPQAVLDNELLFQQVITRGRDTTQSEEHQQDSYPAIVDIVYPDGRGDILWFQSSQGYPVIHRFPARVTLTLNGIYYRIKGDQLYAIGTPNGVISGDQLIRYRTPTRRVGIRLASSLSKKDLSFGKDSITIKQLTLHHLPEQTLIYFNDQDFPQTIKELKESVQHLRQRRDLQQAEPLASSAASHKTWASALFKKVTILLGKVNWKWPLPVPSWRSTASPPLTPLTLDSVSGQQPHQPPQHNPTTEGYTAGHFQGLLQLLCLGIGQWTRRQYPKPVNTPNDSMAQAAVQDRLDEAYQTLQRAILAFGVQRDTVIQQGDKTVSEQPVTQQLYAGQPRV